MTDMLPPVGALPIVRPTRVTVTAVLAASATTSDSRATHTAQTPGRSRHAALVSAVGADAQERHVRDEQSGAAVGLELALHLARLGVAGAGPVNNEIHARLWQLKLERESEERSRAETHRFSETFDSHLSLRSGAVRCAANAQWACIGSGTRRANALTVKGALPCRAAQSPRRTFVAARVGRVVAVRWRVPNTYLLLLGAIAGLVQRMLSIHWKRASALVH